MRRLTTIMMLLGIAMMADAKDYAKYYQNLPVQMSQPILPAIPANQVSILDCGGKGDGTTINTQAFSKAISQLSKKGGGHLNVPAGIYLTGLISLKDNIDLHLEKNAIIVFSEDKNDLIKTDAATGKKEERASTAITASKRKNISITGEGTIDGSAEEGVEHDVASGGTGHIGEGCQEVPVVEHQHFAIAGPAAHKAEADDFGPAAAS